MTVTQMLHLDQIQHLHLLNSYFHHVWWNTSTSTVSTRYQNSLLHISYIFNGLAHGASCMQHSAATHSILYLTQHGHGKPYLSILISAAPQQTYTCDWIVVFHCKKYDSINISQQRRVMCVFFLQTLQGYQSRAKTIITKQFLDFFPNTSQDVRFT